MSIYYEMNVITDNLNAEENKKTGLYPRVISKRTVFLEELIKKTVMRTTMSEEEARMVVDMFWNQVMAELREGNNVCVDDIGMFSLTAKSRTIQDAKEIRADSIEVNRLAFRMSQAFPRKLGAVTFMRKPKDFIKAKKRWFRKSWP